jgi:hypothetical protein
MGTGGPFSAGKAGRGVTLTTHPHLLPRSWMRGAIPPSCVSIGVVWDCFTFHVITIRVNTAKLRHEIPKSGCRPKWGLCTLNSTAYGPRTQEEHCRLKWCKTLWHSPSLSYQSVDTEFAEMFLIFCIVLLRRNSLLYYTAFEQVTIAHRSWSYRNKSHEGAWGERKYCSHSFSTSTLDGGEWSASGPRPRFTTLKGPSVPIVQEAGWTPEPVWTQMLEEKSFSLCWGSNLDLPVVQPVARHCTHR